MRSLVRPFLLTPLVLSITAPLVAQSRDAAAVIQGAIDRMGGTSVLQRIERARFEQMTLWHRQTFEDRPFGDVVGSYERVTDLRDYTIPAWRNVRRFVGPALNGPEVTDLVRDSVAARLFQGAPGAASGWQPLSIAYVDERRELFTFAPERLLVLLQASPDARLAADTNIAGVAHARVVATVDRFPVTVFIRRSDGFLARVRYRAAHLNDFGLAPWGAMDVDQWYGAWRTQPGGLRYPMQWDIARLGVPYKRITILSARFDVAATPDSFVVADDVRARYHATATKPMWDLSLDSARVIDGRFAVLGPPGFSPTAVRIGQRWLLLEGSAVPQRTAVEHAWLLKQEGGAGFGGMVMTAGATPRGGLAWFTGERLPVLMGRGAARGATSVLRHWPGNHAAPAAVTRGQWVRFHGDSIWVEPFDVPDAQGGLLLYVPSLKWVYHAIAAEPMVRDMVMERARTRGWQVERLGHIRAVSTPVAATGSSAR